MEIKRRNQIIGVLILSAFPLYGGGTSLLESSSAGSSDSIIGFTLVLGNSLAVFIIGLFMHGIISPHQKIAANIYLLARIQEALLLLISSYLTHYESGSSADDENGGGVGVVYYHIAMIGLGIGSIPLLTYLTGGKYIPTWLGWTGLIGYPFLVLGMIIDSYGNPNLGLLLLLPGTFFEISFSFWLIAQGIQIDYMSMDKSLMC